MEKNGRLSFFFTRRYRSEFKQQVSFPLLELRWGSSSFFFFLEDHQIFQMCRSVRSLSIQFTPPQGEKEKGISDARKKWQTGKLAHAWAPDDLLVTIGEEEQTLLLSLREHWSDWFLNHCDVRYVYTLSWSGRTMMAVWILPCGKAICPSMSHHP